LHGEVWVGRHQRRVRRVAIHQVGEAGEKDPLHVARGAERQNQDDFRSFRVPQAEAGKRGLPGKKRRRRGAGVVAVPPLPALPFFQFLHLFLLGGRRAPVEPAEERAGQRREGGEEGGRGALRRPRPRLCPGPVGVVVRRAGGGGREILQ